MYNYREMVKIYTYVEKTCNLYKSYFWRKLNDIRIHNIKLSEETDKRK